jgi:hypothetical protein
MEDWLRKKRAQMRAEAKAEAARVARITKVWAEIHAEGWRPTVADVKAIIGICGGDGHGVYSPDTFKAAGVNERWIDLRTSVYKSDGSYKGSMWDDAGKMVNEQRGVNSECLLIGTAEMLGLQGNWTWQQGRGFRAQSATKALYEWMIAVEQSG